MHRCDGIVLEGEDIALAAVLVRIGVAYLQRVNGAVPGAALCLRDQLAAEAARNRPARVSVTSGSAEPGAAVIVAESWPAEMTTAQAAGCLGITPRAVRGMCQAGVLLATRSPARHWRIDPDSAAALAARRKDCNAPTTVPL